MAPDPFLTVPIRRGRDWLHARFRARQLARLFRFPPHEVAAIAALAFVIAQKASQDLGHAELCFAILDRQLHIYARPRVGWSATQSPSPCLKKPLPGDVQQLAAEDAAWLIRQMQQLTPYRTVEEVAMQNHDVLALLAELQSRHASAGSSVSPSAA